MKFFLSYLLLIITAGIFVVGCGRKEADTESPDENVASAQAVESPGQATEEEAGEAPVGAPSREGMVELRGRDIALEFDDVKMTRDELLILLQSLNAIPQQNEAFAAIASRVNGLTAVQQQAVRRVLYALIRQQLLVRAAKAAGTTFTEDDRQRFAELWEEQNPGEKFSDYISQVPVEARTPLTLSRDDQVLLFTWSDAQVRGLKVPEELVQKALSQIQQIEMAFGKQTEADRKEFMELADNSDLYTDEGFAKLAKEYSDGAEASIGGVLKEWMTRSQIAAANFDQPFTTPVGETSSLIETPTSLRYIRVLEEIPGTMPGEPAKLKVAQILYAKRTLDNLPDEEQLRKNLQYRLHTNYFHELIRNKLVEQFHFRCPMIPDLLDFEKLSQTSTDEPGDTADDADDDDHGPEEAE